MPATQAARIARVTHALAEQATWTEASHDDQPVTATPDAREGTVQERLVALRAATHDRDQSAEQEREEHTAAERPTEAEPEQAWLHQSPERDGPGLER